jgi:PAS domain S-box-containing protein
MDHPAGFDDLFRDLADTVPLMMWRADAEGRVVDVNGAWLAFTGREAAAERGEGWLAGVNPEDRPGRIAAFAEALGARRAFAAEYRLRRADGTERWLLDTARPLTRDGHFLGYVGSCVDITERREHEAEAQAALAEKEALLAEIYHRVRNNLQIMVSLIGLYGRAAPEACRPSFDAVGQRVRAIALVQQHLHETTHLASIDLRDYLQRLATGLGQLHRAGRISVTVRGRDTGTVEPRIANALGMILAELVAESLDAAAENATCGLAVETLRAEAGLAVRIHPGAVEPAPERRVPQLGPRLVAAYAAQAGIAVEGRPGTGEVLTLALPAPGGIGA